MLQKDRTKEGVTRKDALSTMEKESPETYAVWVKLSELEAHPSYQFLQRQARMRYEEIAATIAYANQNDDRLPDWQRDLNFYARMNVGFAAQLKEEVLAPFMEGGEEYPHQPREDAIKARLQNRLAAEAI